MSVNDENRMSNKEFIAALIIVGIMAIIAVIGLIAGVTDNGMMWL